MITTIADVSESLGGPRIRQTRKVVALVSWMTREPPNMIYRLQSFGYKACV